MNFITLHRNGKPYYVRADAILRLQEDSDRKGGSSFSIGTQFAQLCDEQPEVVLLRIHAATPSTVDGAPVDEIEWSE